MPGPTRTETDSLGSVDVPADALWGAHTRRGLDNFTLGGPRMSERPDLVRALAQVKVAAARANAELGVLDASVASSIVQAGREVAAGQWHDQFPVCVVHGGGGTVVNMNVNEVLANRAAELLDGARGTYELVHPNDHVNRSQSTNDAYPTALLLATVVAGRRGLAGVAALEASLRGAAGRAGDLVRLGRTCLQDAVPLSARDGHLAQAAALARTGADLAASLDELLAVPLGATAVGTGIGAPPGHRELAIRYLAEESGLAVTPVADMFDALAHLDGYLRVASDLVRVALVAGKLAADLRFLSSGPIGGIGEVRLPAVQVGSSIMPGKVNPVMPELVLQVSYEARGMLATVEAAVAGGELELNVMEPVIARHLLASLDDVGGACRLFAERCIDGLAWDREVVERHLVGSLAGAVEDAAASGYGAAAARLNALTLPTAQRANSV